MPVSNVNVERVFSSLNLTKREKRNKLNNETLLYNVHSWSQGVLNDTDAFQSSLPM